MNRPTWEDYYLSIARVVATRSGCTRSQVGAVFVTADHTAVFGYNGMEPGALECYQGGCPRGKLSYVELAACSDYSNCPSIHAEDNVIRRIKKLGLSVKGGTLYITRPPCRQCEALCHGAGIERIVNGTR